MYRSHFFYELLIESTTLALLVYTIVNGYFPKKGRDALGSFSDENEWLGIESENPYSLLNSRTLCVVLAPICLVALIVEFIFFTNHSI